MSADVFISYSHRDRDPVIALVQELQSAGVSVWLDERSIDGATLWTQEIYQAIAGCQALLLMISQASAASEQVIREVLLAHESNKHICPIYLEPATVHDSLRYPLAGLQFIELFHRDAAEHCPSILRALTHLGVTVPGPGTQSAESGVLGADRPSASMHARLADARSHYPAPNTQHAPTTHNLPRQLSSFIGREAQVAEIRELLTSSCLVTLTGPGGCGKTRLALQSASEGMEAFPDGVWLVELAAIKDPALLPQQVAKPLRLREEPGRSLIETLSNSLASKQALLVLDNCEHLVGPCAELVQTLLLACPDLRFLTTSREALQLPGEQCYSVPPLSLPKTPTVDQLLHSEASCLFVERASSVSHDFQLTEENAPAIAALCRRLDGLPLAIELAAARVRSLSVEQIAARLEDRFRLLAGGSRTAPARHQTLRAALDWSHDLLSEPERTLLRRLSVFAGGFTLEAAEAVCAGEGVRPWALGLREASADRAEDRSGLRPKAQGLTPSLSPEDLLDLLTALVDKSLVVWEEREEEGRYRLLETIREYGVEKRREAGEIEALASAHRDWYLNLAEQAESELQGPRQGEWLVRLEQEHDNLRAALAWCQSQKEAEPALRLGAALWRFWYVRGYLAEGRERLERLLALPGAEPHTAARARALAGAGTLAEDQGDYPAARARYEECLVIGRERDDRAEIATALNGLGTLAEDQGDYTTARGLYEESLALWRELRDKPGIATSLNSLGNIAECQGDYAVAGSLYEETLVLFREIEDPWGIAATLNNLGNLAGNQGDAEAARGFHEESLAIEREIGDKLGIASSLNNLGNLAENQGDYAAAQRLYEESLAIRRELGDKQGIATSLNNLGNAVESQGDHTTARRLYEESLALFRELGDKRYLACSLVGLAEANRVQGEFEAARALFKESLALFRELGEKRGIVEDLEGLASVAQAQPERAARLFGAADALREAIGSPMPLADRAEYDRSVATVRASLGEERFAAERARGRAMAIEDAVAEALAD